MSRLFLRPRPIFGVFLMVFAAAAANAQDTVDGFVARVHGTLPYRLFIPQKHSTSEPLPLVLYLHGSDARGTDNRKQILGYNKPGTHVWTSPKNQGQHAAFVMAPQARGGWDEAMPLVLQAIDELENQFKIDRTRVYIVGQSMGGIGVWYYIARNPDLFAAAVPLCGIGAVEDAPKIRQIPIWAFHGAKDRNVPVSGSRKIIAALRALDSHPLYTEYPDLDHFIWNKTFARKDLMEWLFNQRRS